MAPKAHASAAEDGDLVGGGHATSGDGVKTYRERFDEAEFFDGERSWVKFFGRHGDVLGQRAIALDAECFVEGAGIGTTAEAGGAFAAIRIRRQGDIYTGSERWKRRASFDNRSGDFVAGNARKLDHGIFATEGIQIASAEADHADTEQQFAVIDLRPGNRLDGGRARLFDDQCVAWFAKSWLVVERVDFGGHATENHFLLRNGQPRDEFAQSRKPSLIRRCQKADGPIRAGHQAFGPEGFQDDFEIGQQVRKAPLRPVSFGHHPGKLAKNIFSARQFADVGAPWFEHAVANAGLGEVIQDEDLGGMAVHEENGCGQLTLKDQNVVDEAVTLEKRDTGVEIRAEEEGIVGFVLNNMAQAF